MVATAGGLGVIIPPSIPFVFYGMMTGESVGNMFTAGVLPGILIAVSLMVYAYIYCNKKGEDKEKINAMVDALRSKGLLLVLKESFWAIMSPVIILGGIYSGIVTPTEAATVSVFYSIFVAVFIYKTVEKNEIGKLLRESIAQYAPMILILALAMAFARTLTVLKAPIIIGNFVSAKLGSKVVFLLAVNLLMFMLGMFMDTGPAVVILAPILAPVGAMLGVDPIHLGVIMVANLAVGMVTPPFGLNLFISAPLANEPVSAVSKEALPFIFTFMVALMIITFVPDVSMFLVNMMK
jgi:C4-dicarboxylate transporter DctM subunit